MALSQFWPAQHIFVPAYIWWVELVVTVSAFSPSPILAGARDRNYLNQSPRKEARELSKWPGGKYGKAIERMASLKRSTSSWATSF